MHLDSKNQPYICQHSYRCILSEFQDHLRASSLCRTSIAEGVVDHARISKARFLDIDYWVLVGLGQGKPIVWPWLDVALVESGIDLLELVAVTDVGILLVCNPDAPAD